MPGTNGVNSVSHWVSGDEEAANTPLTEKSTSSSFAQNVAAHAAPTSGEARQVCIFVLPIAVSAPAVASTKTGTFRVWPAAVSERFQTAACVAVPVHPTAIAASVAFVASATITLPTSGRIASGEIALALTCAVTEPIVEPTACVSVAAPGA